MPEPRTRCGHHASLGAMANRDRATPKVWVVALLNRRIERVHVDVDDLANPPFVHLRCGS